MKQILNTYFRSDIASAVFALLIFVATIIMLIGHIVIEAGFFACFIDLLFCLIGWNIVVAVYYENLKDKD